MTLVLIGDIHDESFSFKYFFFFRQKSFCGAEGLCRKNRLSDKILVLSFHFRHGEDVSIANPETKGAAKEKFLAYYMLLCLSRSYKMVMFSVY